MNIPALALLLTLGQVKPQLVSPNVKPGLKVSAAQTRLKHNFNRIGSLSWKDAPTPTFDCFGALGAFGEWNCGGPYIFMPQGTPAPTANNPTLWHPDGTFVNDTQVPAAGFDGANSYFDGGNVAAPVGSFTLCTVFTSNTIAATTSQLIAKADAVGTQSFKLYRGTASLTLRTYKVDNTPATLTVGTIAANATNVACVSYKWVTDGTSELRGNLNGAAATAVTNAAGPIQSTARALRIGAASDGTPTNFWSGSVSRVTYWDGWAATDAQMAAMVADYWNLTATTGQTIAVSRNSTEAFQPVPGGLFFNVPANTLGVTSTGVRIWGANTNAATSFTATRATLAAAASVPDPFNSTSTQSLTEDNTAGNNHYARSAYTATAVAWVGSTFAKLGSAGRPFIMCSLNNGNSWYGFNINTCAVGVQTGTGNTARVTAVAGGWCRVEISRTMTDGANVYVCAMSPDGTTVTYDGDNASYVYLAYPQAELGAIAGPPIAYGGSPVARPASVVSVAGVLPDTTPRKICFAATVTAPWGGLARYWGFANSANNWVAPAYTSLEKLSLITYDANNVSKTWATSAVSYAANSQHSVTECYDPAAHSARISSDGVEQAVAATGTGVAPSAYGTTIGLSSSIWPGYLNGTLSSIRICTGSARPGDCKP